MRPILAAITAAGKAEAARRHVRRPTLPFVTISRQAGAGGYALATSLVDRLNRRDHSAPPWQSFDKELVGRVAGDHRISEALIESLEDTSHNWLKDILGALSVQPSEAAVFKRVAQTIRAIAQVGHAVIVGRGGVFVTRHLPGGIHVRLVAPLETRIRNSMTQYRLDREAAEKRVAEITRNREEFFRRYGSAQVPLEDLFSVTFNTAQVREEKIAELLLPLVPEPESL
ncbi:MAG: cytidylate kinase-like family protein [Planctomycetes bacterium]|nr:cytidylate kinase-like family protein [Planctomycetota bacterium]